MKTFCLEKFAFFLLLACNRGHLLRQRREQQPAASYTVKRESQKQALYISPGKCVQ